MAHDWHVKPGKWPRGQERGKTVQRIPPRPNTFFQKYCYSPSSVYLGRSFLEMTARFRRVMSLALVVAMCALIYVLLYGHISEHSIGYVLCTNKWQHIWLVELVKGRYSAASTSKTVGNVHNKNKKLKLQNIFFLVAIVVFGAHCRYLTQIQVKKTVYSALITV